MRAGAISNCARPQATDRVPCLTRILHAASARTRRSDECSCQPRNSPAARKSPCFHTDSGVTSSPEDSAAIGRTIDLDSIPTTIVGVMPEEFNYPDATQLWSADRACRGSNGRHCKVARFTRDSRTIIRLRAPLDSAAATAALGVVSQRVSAARISRLSRALVSSRLLANARKQVIGDISGSTLPCDRRRRGARAGPRLCANVATLALIRGTVRSRRAARCRIALGATRSSDRPTSLYGDLAVIAVAGGVAGMLVSTAIDRVQFSISWARDFRVHPNLPSTDLNDHHRDRHRADRDSDCESRADRAHNTPGEQAERLLRGKRRVKKRPTRFGFQKWPRRRSGDACGHAAAWRGPSAAGFRRLWQDPGRLRSRAPRHRGHLPAVARV